MTPSTILLIEDEEAKLQHIERFLVEAFPHAVLRSARSVKSGLAEIEARPFDLLVLDMSLPTFDVHVGESGGRPRGFGGREILRYMELEEIQCSTVVVTGYEAFSDPSGDSVDLGDLREELMSRFMGNVVSVLHYSSTIENWKSLLLTAIEEA